MDLVMAEMLQVPKPVLEHVIFCHQEESNWPLMEGAALKKRFDDIFEATRYAKALVELRDLRKELTSKAKDLQVLRERSEGYLREAKRLRQSEQEDADALKRLQDVCAMASERRARATARAKELEAVRDAAGTHRGELAEAEATARREESRAKTLRVQIEEAGEKVRGALGLLATRIPEALGARSRGDVEGYMVKRLASGASDRVRAIAEATESALLRTREEADATERDAQSARAKLDALREQHAKRSKHAADARAADALVKSTTARLRTTLETSIEKFKLHDEVSLPPKQSLSSGESGVDPEYSRDIVSAGATLQSALHAFFRAQNAEAKREAEDAAKTERSAQKRLDEAQAALTETRSTVERDASELKRAIAEQERLEREMRSLGDESELRSRQREAKQALEQAESALKRAERKQEGGESAVPNARRAVEEARAKEKKLRVMQRELQKRSAEFEAIAAAGRRAEEARAASVDLVREHLSQIHRLLPSDVAASAEDNSNDVLKALDESLRSAKSAVEMERRAAGSISEALAGAKATFEAAIQEAEACKARARAALEEAPAELKSDLNNLDEVEAAIQEQVASDDLPEGVPPEALTSVAEAIVRSSLTRHQCRVCGRPFGDEDEEDDEEVGGGGRRGRRGRRSVSEPRRGETIPGSVESSMERFLHSIRTFHAERKTHFDLLEKVRKAREVKARAEREDERRVEAEKRAAEAEASLRAQTTAKEEREEKVKEAVKRVRLLEGLDQSLGVPLRKQLAVLEGAKRDARHLRQAAQSKSDGGDVGEMTVEEADEALDEAAKAVTIAEKELERVRGEQDVQRDAIAHAHSVLQRAQMDLRTVEQALAQSKELRSRVKEAKKAREDRESVGAHAREVLPSRQKAVEEAKSAVDEARRRSRHAHRRMDATAAEEARALPELQRAVSELRAQIKAMEQRMAESKDGDLKDLEEEIARCTQELQVLEEKRIEARRIHDAATDAATCVRAAVNRAEAADAASEARSKCEALVGVIREAEHAAATGEGLHGGVDGDGTIQEEDQSDEDLFTKAEEEPPLPPSSSSSSSSSSDEGGMSVEVRLKRLMRRIQSLDRLEAKLRGRERTFAEKLEHTRALLAEGDLNDVERTHGENVLKHATAVLAVEDLQRYHDALDAALMRYHQIKIAEVNQSIRRLWDLTYKGGDIESIEIASNVDDGSSSAKRSTRSYNYRVMMTKSGHSLDMRGRCSAGQKVLASLVIRLALADSFTASSGILALDEPTTNLDSRNKESLARALALLVKERAAQLQLIVITHDGEFVDRLNAEMATSGVSAHAPRHYFAVVRTSEGGETKRSAIRRIPWGMPAPTEIGGGGE